MSREEAIKIIKECKEKGFKYTFYTVNEYDVALDMAIKALRREDTFLDKILEIIDNEQENFGVSAYEALTNVYNKVVELREGKE